ncbi:MAG: hypothetical protein KKD18_05825 [Nanoarchaeota archaeon]|nr:hypothetical protein [Nanoarchaeota archaeon]MBU0977909.1 hypothetical protein [Nanoarchaeota archaeon]
MEKKWWSVFFVLVILSVGIFITAQALNKPHVKIMPGGLVVVGFGQEQEPYVQFPGASTDEDAGGDSGAVSPDDADVSPEPEPYSAQCYACPYGGVINLGVLEITFEELTGDLIFNYTNCTNATQLEPIDCPLLDTNISCGDGICEGNETPENCPEDCENATLPTSPSGGEENSDSSGGGGGSSDEIVPKEEDKGKTAQPEYYRCAAGGECVTFFGVGKSNCNPKQAGKCELGADDIGASQEPELSPSSTADSQFYNLFDRFVRFILGLPPS